MKCQYIGFMSLEYKGIDELVWLLLIITQMMQRWLAKHVCTERQDENYQRCFAL